MYTLPNITKAIIVSLIVGFLGWGHIASQPKANAINPTPPADTELRNSNAPEDARLERAMQGVCADAFKVNGKALDTKCLSFIKQLEERGFEVIRYEDGTFEKVLAQ